MKVSAINSLVNKNTIKTNKTSNPHKNNSIQNNINLNLNEALARAQVGFTSSFKPTPFGYEYQNGNSDKINYDKEKGSFSYGNSEKSVVFDPASGVETTTIARKNGLEVITKSKKEVIKTISDKKGAILYQLRKDNLTGNYEEYSRDPELKRTILTKVVNGLRSVKVLDLQTGNYVTKGELTWVSNVDEKNNLIVTRNVVTNALVKEESKASSNPFTRIYSEDTGLLTFESYFDKKQGLQIKKGYFESGEISFVEQSSKDGSYVERCEYDEKNNEIRHAIITAKNKFKKVQVFYPGTNKTDYVGFEFKDKKTGEIKYSITQYKKSPNVAINEKTYLSGSDFLTKEVRFHEDGKHPSFVILYDKDGSRTEMTYGKDTYLKQVERFNSNNFRTSYIEYISEDGFKISANTRIYRAVDIDPKTGIQDEYFYDRAGKFYIEHYSIDKNGNILQKEIYYPNSNDTHFSFEYYNGVCTKTTFTKNGDIERIEQYSTGVAPSSKQPLDDEEDFESKFREISLKPYTSENYNRNLQSNDAVIKKVADIVDKEGNVFQITDKEWSIILKEFGLKNINELDNLDSARYEKMAKKIISKTNSTNMDKTRNLLAILRFFYKG